MSLLKEETDNFYIFLKNYSNELIIFSTATLFIILNNYNQIENGWISSFIYYFICPNLIIILVLRRNPLEFGLRIGNFRLWKYYVIGFLLIALPLVYLTSSGSSFQSYYVKPNIDILKYSLTAIVYMLGWEFLFRGYLIFGLKDKFKEGSILIQMIPFVLLHLGKPEIETISTIISGIIWGYFSYRGNSFWPAFLIHIVINISNKYLINV